jgi:RNA polymerase sigma-54 factor
MEFGLERVSAAAMPAPSARRSKLSEAAKTAATARPAPTSQPAWTPPSSAAPSATTGRTAPSATTSTASASCRRPQQRQPSGDATATTTSRSTARDHGPSLQDHLRRQLPGMRLVARGCGAVMVLIESLNEDGYLADPLEEIAERLAEMGIDGDDGADARDELMDRLRCALKWLQSLEPTGVGASRLGDCLCLQLKELPKTPAREVAMAVCRNHLELLARRDMKKLVAATGADEDTLREAQALIVACEPKPGRPFTKAEANIVVPDVIVIKAGRGWKATLNPDVMPKLRINDLYAQAIRGQRNGRPAG